MSSKIQIGGIARKLRDTLGITQRTAAEALGISVVHLCNIENEKSQPSPELLDRYCDLWGVDLYVMAWCDEGRMDKLPVGLRQAASDLSKAWQAKMQKAILKQKRKGIHNVANSKG